MAAGVADAWESIIFCIEDDRASTCTVGIGNFKGSWETVGRTLDVVAGVCGLEGIEEGADVVVGLVLGVT